VTFMRVCDACSLTIDDSAVFAEVVGPEGQRHYHDDGICWTKVQAGLAAGEAEARDAKKPDTQARP